MSQIIIDFEDIERPLIELEKRINELKAIDDYGDSSHQREIYKLERRLRRLRRKIFDNLTPWQRVLLARHLDRPHTIDYIERIFEIFVELHGDRAYSDDNAIIAGMGKIDGIGVFIAGHEKGRNAKEKVSRNFGMPHPEGYRKAMRIMGLAERLKKPFISFIDTPGAWPGVGAEERGQAEAIARNLYTMASLRTRTISVIIGEGGSGGALALAVTDRIIMMEHAIFSVISPEGCAAILWKDETKKELAAEALKLTAQDAYMLGIVDAIIKEPPGGAHRDMDASAREVKKAILENLYELMDIPIDDLIIRRYEKYRKIGTFIEEYKV
jgi:acetyl-CoA carboxylase carboxyl transferase subunit alpha